LRQDVIGKDFRLDLCFKLDLVQAREGTQALKMTLLSCHRFRSNEVQLWLSLIAYNLGNLWRRPFEAMLGSIITLPLPAE